MAVVIATRNSIASRSARISSSNSSSRSSSITSSTPVAIYVACAACAINPRQQRHANNTYFDPRTSLRRTDRHRGHDVTDLMFVHAAVRAERVTRARSLLVAEPTERVAVRTLLQSASVHPSCIRVPSSLNVSINNHPAGVIAGISVSPPDKSGMQQKKR